MYRHAPRSFLGWEEFEVVDPDAEGAKRGEKADGGLRQDVSSRAQWCWRAR